MKKLAVEKSEKKSEISSLAAKLVKTTSEFDAKITKISSLKSALQALLQKKDQGNEKLRQKMTLLRQTEKNFTNRFGGIEIERLSAEIENCEAAKRRFKGEIENVDRKIDDLKSQRSTFEIRESNLQDALELIKKLTMESEAMEKGKAEKEKLKVFANAGTLEPGFENVPDSEISTKVGFLTPVSNPVFSK